MTEKRFTVQRIYKGMDNGVKYHDWCVMKDGTVILRLSTRMDCKDVVEILNELSEENEQLKIQLQNTSAQRDEFYHGARENANRVGKLKKENEQLKKILNELSDMLQFDVKNEIRSYPVKLSEYLSNALKELQKND